MDLAGEIKEVHRPNEGKEKTNASLGSCVDDLEHYTHMNIITFSGLETRPQYDSNSAGWWVAHQARHEDRRATGLFFFNNQSISNSIKLRHVVFYPGKNKSYHNHLFSTQKREKCTALTRKRKLKLF